MRVVADHGATLHGKQKWRCIEWPAAHHGGVEGVQTDKLCDNVGESEQSEAWYGVEGVQADELRGGGRTS